MDVEYKKDLYHNYMLIHAKELNDMDRYCIKILKYQEIDGVLSMEQRNVDNQISFFYDITAKQSMQNLYEKSMLSYHKVKNLFTQLIETIRNAYEYLLNENDFVLTPELIYLDLASGGPYLCYFPCYHINIKEQLGRLIEFIMNKVDYNDKEAVLLVYNLYAASKEEGYTLNYLLEILNNQDKSTQVKTVNNEYSKMMELPQKSPFKMEDDVNNSGMMNKEETEAKIQPTNIQIPVMKERLVTEEDVTGYPLKTYLYTGLCMIGGVALIGFGVGSKLIYNTFGNQIDYSKLFAILLLTFCLEGYFLKIIWNKKNRSSKLVSKTEYVNPIEEFYSKESVMKGIEINKTNKEDLRRGDKRADVKANSVNEKNFSKFKYNKGRKQESEEQIECLKDNNQPHRNSQLLNSNEIYRAGGKFQVKEYQEEEHFDENLSCEQPTCLLNGNDSNLEIDHLENSDLDPNTAQKQSQNRLKRLIMEPLDQLIYETIILTEFPFFVGKLKQNVDYCLENDVVSRYHAKISKEQEHFYITDLNSKNGTFVNNEAVGTYQMKEIQIGDEIAFANIKFRFAEQELIM